MAGVPGRATIPTRLVACPPISTEMTGEDMTSNTHTAKRAAPDLSRRSSRSRIYRTLQQYVLIGAEGCPISTHRRIDTAINRLWQAEKGSYVWDRLRGKTLEPTPNQRIRPLLAHQPDLIAWLDREVIMAGLAIQFVCSEDQTTDDWIRDALRVHALAEAQEVGPSRCRLYNHACPYHDHNE